MHATATHHPEQHVTVYPRDVRPGDAILLDGYVEILRCVPCGCGHEIHIEGRDPVMIPDDLMLSVRRPA